MSFVAGVVVGVIVVLVIVGAIVLWYEINGWNA
jgi:hypothetical protein